MIRALAPLLAPVLAAAALGGCSLLSTPEPVQLYRFGDTDPPSQAAGVQRTILGLAPIEFPAAARGDRILTVSGGSVAYLSGGRWVSPAEQLFASTLEAAFQRDAQRVTLTDRREMLRPNAILDVDLTTFEARYTNGTDYPPTVVVAGRVRIVAQDRSVLAEETFMVEADPAENRVSSIVMAFDEAVAGFNAAVITWADASAPN